MSQTTPSFGSWFVREIPGMIIFFAVVVGLLKLSHHFQEPVMKWFALDDVGAPGTDGPPWYFITHDLTAGICALGALLLSLLVAAITWRRWTNLSGIMVWMSLITHGGDIAKSWIITRACPGILDGQRITNRWPTFESYLHDPAIDRAQVFIWIIALILAVTLSLLAGKMRFRGCRANQGPQPDDGDTHHPQAW